MARAAVLRPGGWVRYDGEEHQVLALGGVSVRLRGHDGSERVVLATHLMTSTGFEVIGRDAAPVVEPFGLLDSLPAEQRLRVPMRPDNRSLNLSNTVAVVVFEAWRQMGFEGAAI